VKEDKRVRVRKEGEMRVRVREFVQRSKETQVQISMGVKK
jgi:hypothetical protein